ncbi:Neither inactivation nor afterpotential protein C, partial [Pseudolycoriella hygida]
SINSKKSAHIQRISGHEFSVAHYTGKITYDARDLADKNRDFLPPEMVETMRTSTDGIVKMMFTNQLSKTGNLTMAFEEQQVARSKPSGKSKWGAVLVAEKTSSKKLNTLSHGQYSQVHKMRTLSSVFRATSLEILKGLSVGGNSGNTHFVRCIRADLEHNPRGFQTDMVYQQLRALAIPDTVVARQKGYPQRVSFQEFLRRYKFLAFDFDENVEMTKDNCRLLLIRLKMEGWLIGKTKVFLKYYNVEYLSRLYETQVKKIVKVQSMMRAFLAKRNVASKIEKIRQDSVQKELKRETSTDEAAITIQKAYRGFLCRRKYGPLINKSTGNIDAETFAFVKSYAKRWKEKTIFQVLLHYRAARYHDLVNMSQQVHIFNQGIIDALQKTNNCIILDKIDPKETNPANFGPIRPSVYKIPFRFADIPYFDTMYMCDPITESYSAANNSDSDQEPWDAPLRRTKTISSRITTATQMPYNQSSQTDVCGIMNDLITVPFTRDPSTPMPPFKRRGSKPPAPLPPEPIYENLKPQDFQKSNATHESSISKPSVHKKRAPPTPVMAAPPMERPNSWGKKKPAPQPSALKKFESHGALNGSEAIKPKLNPVREMEMMGRNKSAESDDEAPFNFQGMLRKTKYNRASMKRSASNQDSLEDRERNVVTFEMNNNRFEESKIRYTPLRPSTSSNLIYQSNKSMTEEPNIGYTKSMTEGSNIGNARRMTKESNIGNAKEFSGEINCVGNAKESSREINCVNRNPIASIGRSDSNGSEVGVYIQEEIHPGVILEGYAVEI